MNLLIVFFTTLASLIVIDSIWLNLASSFYKERLAHLFAGSFSYGPALIFYPIYALAIALLVVLPAIKGGSSMVSVILLSALLGLAAYGAYDLTNAATLRSWPLAVTIVDMAWGTFLTAACGAIAFGVAKLFG